MPHVRPEVCVSTSERVLGSFGARQVAGCPLLVTPGRSIPFVRPPPGPDDLFSPTRPRKPKDIQALLQKVPVSDSTCALSVGLPGREKGKRIRNKRTARLKNSELLSRDCIYGGAGCN